jgi:hypothetical protein
MEESNKTALGEIIRTLKILHLAIVLSSILFLVVSFVIVSIIGPLIKMERADSQLLLTIGMVAGAALVGLAYYIHSQRLQKINPAPLEMKLKSYRVSMLLKIAFMEAASFFVLVIYLLTGIYSMLVAAAIIIIIMLLNRPGEELISHELNINGDENL